MKFKKLTIDLQFFASTAGTGAGAGVGEGGAASAGVTAADAGQYDGTAENQTGDSTAAAGQQNGVASAKTGDNTAAAGQKTDAEGDLSSEFEKMIKKGGKFSDQYNRSIRDIIFGRTKSLEGKLTETQGKMDKLSPALALLAKHYGTPEDDFEALSARIAEDETFYRKVSIEKGVPIDVAKKLVQNDQELALTKQELKKRDDAAAAEQERRKQAAAYQSFKDEGEKIKEIYPNFDFDSESEADEKFFNAVVLFQKNGFENPVRNAYELFHRDEILSHGMHAAADAAAKRVVNNVRQNGARPQENGTGTTGAAMTQNPMAVSQMTEKQILELGERAARGEKIRL